MFNVSFLPCDHLLTLIKMIRSSTTFSKMVFTCFAKIFINAQK